MNKNDLPFIPVFVGGTPRSGTTMINALACSTDRANDQINECSYFRDLVKVYHHRKRVFDIHDHSYFDTQEDFQNYHRAILKDMLMHSWEVCGKPEILVLKSPEMCEYFDTLHELFPQSKFIVVYRNPLDVMSSRLVVLKKLDVKPNFSHIREICTEYKWLYRAFLTYINTIPKENLIAINYDKFVKDKPELTALNEFMGVDDLSYDKMWKKDFVKDLGGSKTPWKADLYGKPVSASHIGRSKKVLNPFQRLYVYLQTRKVAKNTRNVIDARYPM